MRERGFSWNAFLDRLRRFTQCITCLFILALTVSCGTENGQAPNLQKTTPKEISLNQDGEYYEKTNRYTVSLRVPLTANDVASKHMQDFVTKRAAFFIELTKDEPLPGYFDEHQYEISTNWDTAESDAIYTFIIRGSTYTGGAHNQHFLKTFSYKKADHLPIALSEILASPQSLEEIGKLATQHFRETLGDQLDVSGLAPEAANWENWLVSNASLTLLFPPYQIAPFAAGERSFTVYVDEESQHLFNTDFFAPVNNRQVEIWDEHGHGPDPGSEEAARSAAWQLVQQSESYDNDGFGLEITNLKRISASPSIYIAEYSWRHYGDLASFYTGKVRIEDDEPRFVADSQNIVGPAEILTTVLSKAATSVESGKDGKLTAIDRQTPIADLLNTEHQFMTVYGLLQQRYGLGREMADKLWQELSGLETVGEWVNQITVSEYLVD